MALATLDQGANLHKHKINAEDILTRAEDRFNDPALSADDQVKEYLKSLSQDIRSIVEKTPAIGRADEFDGNRREFLDAEKAVRDKFVALSEKILTTQRFSGRWENTRRALQATIHKYQELFKDDYYGDDKKAILSVLNGIFKDRNGQAGTVEGQDYFQDLTLPQDVGLIARHRNNLAEVEAATVQDSVNAEQNKAQEALKLLNIAQDSDLQLDVYEAVNEHFDKLRDYYDAVKGPNAAGTDVLTREQLLDGFKTINTDLQNALTAIEDNLAYDNDELTRLVVEKARGVFIRGMANVGKDHGLDENGLYQIDDKASKVIGSNVQRKNDPDFVNTFQRETVSALMLDAKGNPVRQPRDIMVATLAHGTREVKFAFTNTHNLPQSEWRDRIAQAAKIIANADPDDLFDTRGGTNKLNVQSKTFQELFSLADGKMLQMKNVDIEGAGRDDLANLFSLDMVSVKPIDPNEVSLENVTFKHVDLSNSAISVGDAGGVSATEFRGKLLFETCCLARADVDVVVRDPESAEFHMDDCDLSGASVDAELHGIKISKGIFGWFQKAPAISITGCNALTARALPTKYDLMDSLAKSLTPPKTWIGGIIRKYSPSREIKHAKTFRKIYAKTQFRFDVKNTKDGARPPFGVFTTALNTLAVDVTTPMVGITSPQLMKLMKDNQIATNEKIKIGDDDGYVTTSLATGDNLTRMATRINEDGTMNFVFTRKNNSFDTWEELNEKKLKALHGIDDSIRKQHKNLNPEEALKVLSYFGRIDIDDLVNKARKDGKRTRVINP